MGMEPQSTMTGRDFREWRRSAGLTQAAAGAALGVSRRSVQLYEGGEQPIPLAVALACRAVALGWRDYAA